VTCREEVIAAFERLGRESEHVDFTPAQIITAMRTAGSVYRDSTIRTHVVAHMFDDGTLVRVGPGRYRLARHRHRAVVEQPSPSLAGDRITEDAVKLAVKRDLEAEGWRVEVRWGRDRGIDIDARRGNERLIVEAKGEAPPGPQQVNYFLGALGELVRRMTEPMARYGLALPDNAQYRGLVGRLPAYARERFRLDVFFVDGGGQVTLSRHDRG
jgi:hypothetical protein